jgi:hypothetical protein
MCVARDLYELWGRSPYTRPELKGAYALLVDAEHAQRQ